MRLPFGLRWWELVPEAVLALGLGLFLLTETNAATSAFKSERALVLMAVTAVAWLALRVALGRLQGRWRLPRTGAFGVGALAILAIVVLPAYDDETVVETLRFDVPTSAPTTTPTTVAGSSPETTPDSAPETTTTTAALEPRVVAGAALYGIDHDATGTVTIYELPDGAFVVGLEEIDIQPGPDYDVYLVPGVDRDDKDGGIRLDDLRGNRGTQYYDVPTGTTVAAGEWTVLVWCQTFAVPVAAATPV